MKKIQFNLCCLALLTICLSACHLPIQAENEVDALEPPVVGIEQPIEIPSTEDEQELEIKTEIGTGEVPPGALPPGALTYLGAFRLPDDSGGMGWEYSGQGMTYYPDGDPQGAADGFPGSLYVIGHDLQPYVAEISIPAPVDSRNLEDLNIAQTLQPFADITGGFLTEDLEIPYIGIEYLPAQAGQEEGKLHFAIGEHLQDFAPSHGWASLDLTNPESEGLWVFNGYANYVTNDYLFEIPQDWASNYINNYLLASGRFREGVWGGLGPTLFAYAPWEDGNPPTPGSRLTAIQPLLLYGTQIEGVSDLLTDDSMRMDGYAEADHWWGGAWLTSDVGNAVVFVGTKTLGKNWYGFANGVVWDYNCADNPEVACPEVPEFPYDSRGYWAEDYFPAILFFDPQDLSRVAQGEIATYDPQPYALMDLTAYWFDPEMRVEIYKRDLVGAAAFDRTNGLLYIIERLADECKSVIHVFRIGNQ